ncbi:MAG: LptA/OstA family protein [Sphaerochaetaceae bacterium]|nr:hypothetical protein [Sphaerochaetaceae bacterium]NLO60418.1 hypothetical protein [Spirochaetales bacterium]MDD2405408.1 LptA/OstA family protein [Sphaerochaetaceae bacterium]MDD3670137.1 LptA/OstA family protein [Sphaerochaetaceae bacterium]MDD4259593.1 LptA/OstA family protein [Sphaerochaetaceae bacterium]
MTHRRSRLNKIVAITVLIMIIAVPLFSVQQEKITFKGGYTKASTKDGKQAIMLSDGAVVTVGSIVFEADSIELSGEDFRFLNASEKVVVVDTDKKLQIESSTLTYDRLEKQLIIDDWVEIQDLNHQIIATGAFLTYEETNGVILLQIEARLSRHTDSGAMVCRADSIRYDRANQKLILTGNSSVYWKNDRYQAHTITVDLNTEQIVMEGAIQGIIHG